MSPLVPPPWLYRGTRPEPAAGRARRVAVRGTVRGHAMRQGWAAAGRDAHHRLPAGPRGFPEPGAGQATQPGNGMGRWGAGAHPRGILRGAGRVVCWDSATPGCPLVVGCSHRGDGQRVAWGRLLAMGNPQGQLSLLGVCPPAASHLATQEFENTEGDDYVTELSAQGSPAPQHGPEVYVLPLTKVSLPMAKQPGRSGKPRRGDAGVGVVMVLVGPPIPHGWRVLCHRGAGRGQRGGVRTVGRGGPTSGGMAPVDPCSEAGH